MLRVLVADDHQLTIDAVKAALLDADGIKVLSEAVGDTIAPLLGDGKLAAKKPKASVR